MALVVRANLGAPAPSLRALVVEVLLRRGCARSPSRLRCHPAPAAAAAEDAARKLPIPPTCGRRLLVVPDGLPSRVHPLAGILESGTGTAIHAPLSFSVVFVTCR